MERKKPLMAITLSVILLLVVFASAKGKGTISVRSRILKETQANVACVNPNLLGMHETVAFRSLNESNYTIKRAFEEMEALGVRKLRMQIWRETFMDFTNNSIEIRNRGAIEQVIQEADTLNIDILAYAQDFPEWMRNVPGDPQTVPRRDTAEYSDFLEKYEESWRILATEFPEIKVWEIGNEYNLPEFLHPPGYNESDSTTWFNKTETAKIVTDLLYYGSRGINASNPDAKTVLGGLAAYNESEKHVNGIYDIGDFLDLIYKNIESDDWPSTDPNEFFEVACWHPYTFGEKPTEENWVKPNKAVHEVMKNHSDGNKRVIFSEMGYSDNDTDPFHYASPDRIAEYLLDAFGLAQAHLQGWLETIYWYSLTDRNKDGFGVLESPETWAWKPAAYAYKCVLMTIAFGSSPGDPNWNQAADINNDDVVDIFDIVLLANNFGKST